MSLRVLAFDTATEVCALALGSWPSTDAEGKTHTLASRDFPAPRAALSRLLPAVRDLLDERGETAESIDIIVVGRGPGSYTGVRIGMATAKGLAHGLGVPVLGIGTLDAVAWRFADHEGLLGIVGDAMRQEVYPALFECAGGTVRRLSADTVCLPEEAARRWSDEVTGDILLAGDGLSKHGDVFLRVLGARAAVASEDRWSVSGEGCLLAAWDTGEEALLSAAEVLPVYTRLSDAEAAERRAVGPVPTTGVAGPDDASGQGEE